MSQEYRKTKKITRENYVDGSDESSGDWNSHCTREADLQLTAETPETLQQQLLSLAEQIIKIDKFILSAKINVKIETTLKLHICFTFSQTTVHYYRSNNTM